MVGREVDVDARPRAASTIGEVMLELDGLSAEGDRGEEAVRDVSLTVRAGEILGVAGVAGNGQRELAEAVTGHAAARRRAPSASAATRCARATRARRSRPGVAHVPEDRLHTGVAPSLSIASNIALKSYRTDDSRRAVPPARRASATAPSS